MYENIRHLCPVETSIEGILAAAKSAVLIECLRLNSQCSKKPESICHYLAETLVIKLIHNPGFGSRLLTLARLIEPDKRVGLIHYPLLSVTLNRLDSTEHIPLHDHGGAGAASIVVKGGSVIQKLPG